MNTQTESSLRVVWFLGFLLLSGCVSDTPIRQFATEASIPVSGKSRPIMFRKLISKMKRGQEVGTVQQGVACLGKNKVFWKRGGQIQIGDAELGDILKEELTAQNYEVVGEPNTLFEDPKEWKSEFLIAGIIQHVAFNICYPYSGFGNYTTTSGEASIEIEWQIYQRRTRAVVLKTTTGGTAKTGAGPEQGTEAYYRAFAKSVRNLLANNKLVSILSRTVQPKKENGNILGISVVSLSKVDANKIPEVVQHAYGAVVKILIGSGHGSGFIVSSEGYVLTNTHVVGKSPGMITIELSTGRRVVGEVIRTDSETDVALIKLEKGKYHFTPIGFSASLRVGDPVLAIGTPLREDFHRTLTKGVVSAFRVEEGRRLIQSDVTIHPGNSGGPLLDKYGRVVGLAHSGIVLGGKVGVGLNFF